MRPRESPLCYSMPLSFLNDKKEKGTFSGYASTFSVDLQGDKIEKGAFDATLQEWSYRKRWPHIYWEHDIEDPIGVCLDMDEDDKGLFIRGKLLLDIPRARQAYQSLSDDIRGLSIGFVPTQSFMKKGIRHIQRVCLKEISLVRTPCNAEAKICEYKTGQKDNYTEWIKCLSDIIRR